MHGARTNQEPKRVQDRNDDGTMIMSVLPMAFDRNRHKVFCSFGSDSE